MTHKPYDPEAAVALLVKDFLSGKYDDQLIGWVSIDKIEIDLRAALDAAYRAGKREAWGKAHSLFRRDPDGETYLDVYLESDRTAETIRGAARADGVDLS